HRAAGGNGGIAKLGFPGRTPSGQQAAYDDAAIEKVRERRARCKLKRKSPELRIPCHAGKKACRTQSGVKIGGIARALMQKEKGAHGIAGDFGGDGRVLPE